MRFKTRPNGVRDYRPLLWTTLLLLVPSLTGVGCLVIPIKKAGLPLRLELTARISLRCSRGSATLIPATAKTEISRRITTKLSARRRRSGSIVVPTTRLLLSQIYSDRDQV